MKSSLQTHFLDIHSSLVLQSESLLQTVLALFATLRHLLKTSWNFSIQVQILLLHSEYLSLSLHWSCVSQCLFNMTDTGIQRPSLVFLKSFLHSHFSLIHSVLGIVQGHSFRSLPRILDFDCRGGRRRKTRAHGKR